MKVKIALAFNYIRLLKIKMSLGKFQFCKDVNPQALNTFYHVDNQMDESERMVLHAAIVNSAKWSQGRTLNVLFLNGAPEQHAVVKRVVEENFGPKQINLKWRFLPSGSRESEAQIRITFNPQDGAWSYLGNECLQIKTGATMNLGWLDDPVLDAKYSGQDVVSGASNGVVKHEFGHALALIHEFNKTDLQCVQTDKNFLRGIRKWDKSVSLMGRGILGVIKKHDRSMRRYIHNLLQMTFKI